MLKRLTSCIKEYRTPTILTLVFIVAEAIIEAFIPFITANLVNTIKAGAEIKLIAEIDASISYAGIITMIIAGGTIVASLLSDRLIR